MHTCSCSHLKYRSVRQGALSLLARVAEKSYLSYQDCIQIEISASNFMTSFTQFVLHHLQCFIVGFFVLHLKYYLQYIANCTKVLDAGKYLASIGCSRIACIRNVSSVLKYHIKATMDAGIHAAKLSEIIGCRQIDACIGCSITPCHQSVSRSCNYCIQQKQQKLEKYCNTRSYIQSNLGNGWLHPANIVCYPAPGCHPISPSQPKAYSHKGCTLCFLLCTLYLYF